MLVFPLKSTDESVTASRKLGFFALGFSDVVVFAVMVAGICVEGGAFEVDVDSASGVECIFAW